MRFAYHLGAFRSVALFTALFFTLEFLRLKEYFPGGRRVIIAMMGAFGVLFVVNLSPVFDDVSVWFGYVTDSLVAVALVMILLSGAVAWKRGFQPAPVFLLSWACLILMAGIDFLGTYGLVRGTDFLVQHSLPVGASMEMILLSSALVTRFNLLRREKREAEERALHSRKLRSLVQVISHDLRNPLAIVLGYAQAGKDEGKKEWEPVARAAKQQQMILDYVGSLEAVQAPERRPRLQAVSLGEVVDNVLFVFEKKLKEKKIRLIDRISNEAGDLQVWAEPVVLTHSVMNNLMSNAIKFTQVEGEIELSAVRAGDEIEIRIRDTGVGIPAELLTKLFSSDAATIRSGTEGERGTGFGMPLVKSLVDAFGGRIDVESTTPFRDQGSGTTVRVFLKAVDPSVAAVAEGTEA